MNKFSSISFVISWMSAATIALSWATPPSLSQAKPAAPVEFPEVGLALLQPEGFEKAETFNGFQQPSTRSSVMLASIPGSFAEVGKKFDTLTLEARGLKLLSKVEMNIQNQPGVLLHISQSAYGQAFLKWIVVFGTEARTNIVTATFPKDSAGELSERLKQTVLKVSVTQVKQQQALDLPFTLVPAPGLRPVVKVRSLGKVMAFTQDGELHTDSPSLPFLIVAPSLGAVPILDRKSYALNRLNQTAQTRIKTVESIAPVTVDGLEGYEAIATGTDVESGTALKVYQTMLFLKNGGYAIVTGLVGADLASLYLPKFKATARTYRQK
jgi:hypothetical protein